MARLPLSFAIIETRQPFVYQRIAAKAAQLSKLGLPLSRVAGLLGVTDKTVAKALRWVATGKRE